MKNNFYYTFPAIKGRQADREFYVIMCPLNVLSKLFIFNEDDLPPEHRAQRILNKTRIPEMASYIVNNPKDYVFSSLTASIDGNIEFSPLDKSFDEKIGTLKVAMDSRMLINDGQHRRAAIEEAIKGAPELSEETISVVLFIDEGLKRSQQIFADLNKHAVNVSKSIGILYEQREPIAMITKELLESNTNLRNFTDKEATSIAKFSPKLFTLSVVHSTNEKLLNKINLSHDEKLKLTTEFWDVLCENMKEWNFVFNKEINPCMFRNDYISSLGIVLEALGMVGNFLVQNHTKNWTDKLSLISQIDWNRTNLNDWQYRVIGKNGRISGKSTRNIKLTNNLIKQKIGLDLTKEEQKLENECIFKKDE